MRDRPELVLWLLEQALGVAVPPHARVRLSDADATQLAPATYHADLVAVCEDRDGRPVLGVVIEPQLARDPRKPFTWPLYAAALHGRLECATYVLVLAGDDAMARWAARSATTFQPNSLFALWASRLPANEARP